MLNAHLIIGVYGWKEERIKRKEIKRVKLIYITNDVMKNRKKNEIKVR